MDREEAIGRIKAWNLDSDDMEVLAVVIPELAESEDERMKRIIMKFVWGYTNTPHSIINGDKSTFEYAKEVEAYLEKQKPAIFYVPDDADLSHPRNKLAFMLGQYRKQGHINEEEYWSMLNYLIEKEQKSSQTDTEKEYVRTLKSLISDFLHGKQEIDTGYYQQIYDWLDGRHIEQKVLPGFDGLTPEEKMNHPLYLEGFDVGRDVQKVFDEQKHEWSEDEEKMLENIRYALRYAYFNSVIDEQTTENAMTFLKSLRPSWKPSEEQMRFLLAVINEPNNAGSESCHLVLKELYEQLKRL